jgi:hypothetical protein
VVAVAAQAAAQHYYCSHSSLTLVVLLLLLLLLQVQCFTAVAAPRTLPLAATGELSCCLPVSPLTALRCATDIAVGLGAKTTAACLERGCS